MSHYTACQILGLPFRPAAHERGFSTGKRFHRFATPPHGFDPGLCEPKPVARRCIPAIWTDTTALGMACKPNFWIRGPVLTRAFRLEDPLRFSTTKRHPSVVARTGGGHRPFSIGRRTRSIGCRVQIPHPSIIFRLRHFGKCLKLQYRPVKRGAQGRVVGPGLIPDAQSRPSWVTCQNIMGARVDRRRSQECLTGFAPIVPRLRQLSLSAASPA